MTGRQYSDDLTSSCMEAIVPSHIPSKSLAAILVTAGSESFNDISPLNVLATALMAIANHVTPVQDTKTYQWLRNTSVIHRFCTLRLDFDLHPDFNPSADAFAEWLFPAAVMASDIPALEMMLNSGIDMHRVRQWGDDNETLPHLGPLQIACQQRNRRSISLLLGSESDAGYGTGLIVLYIVGGDAGLALMSEVSDPVETEILDMLINHGAKIDDVFNPEQDLDWDCYRLLGPDVSPILAAARTHQPTVLDYLLNKGSNYYEVSKDMSLLEECFYCVADTSSTDEPLSLQDQEMVILCVETLLNAGLTFSHPLSDMEKYSGMLKDCLRRKANILTNFTIGKGLRATEDVFTVAFELQDYESIHCFIESGQLVPTGSLKAVKFPQDEPDDSLLQSIIAPGKTEGDRSGLVSAAVENGAIWMLNQLIKEGIKISFGHSVSLESIVGCCLNGHTKMIRHVFTIHPPSKDLLRVVIISAQKLVHHLSGDELNDILETLRSVGIDFDIPTAMPGSNRFKEAIMSRNQPVVQGMLVSGAPLDPVFYCELDHRTTGTLLILAAYWGDEEIVNKAFQAGLKVNSPGYFGSHEVTLHENRPPKGESSMCLCILPLAAAILSSNQDLIQALIDKGASIENPAHMHQSLSPLMAAICTKNEKMTDCLLSRGASVEDWSGISAAIGQDDPTYLQILLSAGLSPNSMICWPHEDKEWIPQTSTEESYLLPLLLLAIRKGNVRTLETLLQAGSRVDLGPVSFGCEHPLIEAMYHGKRDIFRLLLHHGSEPNGFLDKESPIVHAIALGNIEAVQLLLEHGADPTSVMGDFSLTPLEMAAKWGLPGIVSRLLSYGANMNFHDPTAKHTSLELAAINGRIDVLLLLLDAKDSSPFIKTPNYHISRKLALSHRNFAAARLIEFRTPISIDLVNPSKSTDPFSSSDMEMN